MGTNRSFHAARRASAFVLSLLLAMGFVPVQALAETADGLGAVVAATEESSEESSRVATDEDTLITEVGKDVEPAANTEMMSADDANAASTDDDEQPIDIVSDPIEANDALEPTVTENDALESMTLSEDSSDKEKTRAGEQSGLEAQSDAVVTKGAAKVTAPSVSYRVHVQTYGDQKACKDGAVAGTSGESKRLEAIWLSLKGNTGISGGISYRTHVQTYGWQDWVSDGEKSGTSGESKRLEAIRIKLTGDMAKRYDVWYRVHAQRVGWTNWAKNGGTAGTSGLSWRLEAIQVVLALKGGNAPGDVGGVSSASSSAYVRNPGITYRTHVQTYGWQDWVKNGKRAGTVGESKRLEALEAKLANDYVPGGVRYSTHVQTYGWQGWRSDGALAGTEGESKRLEAICIELTGEVAQYFDVWYRVQVQTFGWLGWAKNGESTGTTNLSKRMETLQVKLVPKGGPAPGRIDYVFIDKDPTLSGDAELDAMIGQFIKRTGTGYDGLRRAYEIISSYPYSQGNRWPGPNWEDWSIPYAKEMYLNHTGNCYRYASLMCWTARRLGYDAKVVPGWIPGRVNPHCDHGWVEVLLDGQVYVIDAEMNGDDGYPEYNWFMIKYSDAYLRYYDLNDNRILR